MPSPHEGTPTYVYSAAKIRDQYAKLAEAVDGLNALICYAMKADSFPARPGIDEFFRRRGRCGINRRISPGARGRGSLR